MREGLHHQDDLPWTCIMDYRVAVQVVVPLLDHRRPFAENVLGLPTYCAAAMSCHGKKVLRLLLLPLTDQLAEALIMVVTGRPCLFDTMGIFGPARREA